jgi:methylenetetrahydrofolate reductase (NADPH)
MGFEVIPLKNVHAQVAHLSAGSTVSVTCSPTKTINETLELCAMFAEAGHTTIPHLAARMVESEDHVAAIVTRLRDHGIRTVFVVGGDADQRGPFSDAAGFLRSFLERRPEVKTVGIGAYPDGHPTIPAGPLASALAEKQSMICDAGLDGYLATQMCFDVSVIAEWLTAQRAAGITLPCHLGVPGAVDSARLLSISLRLGVGVSARYLKKNRGSVLRLLSPRRYDPNRLITPLTSAADELGITELHCFTFNSVEATEAWRRKSLAGLS